MGLNRENYYDLSCSEFAERHEAVTDKLNRKYEINIGFHVAIRKLAFFARLQFAEKGFSFSRFIKEEWPLPGDDKQAAKKAVNIKMSPEEMQQAYAALNRTLQLKRRKNKT